MQKLYMLTLLLPDRIEEKLLQFRKEVAQRYGSVAALKPMGHISLLANFVFDEAALPQLQEKFEAVFNDTSPFRVELENFGAFPVHTIFVAIRDFFPFIQLRYSLHRQLSRHRPSLSLESAGAATTPHIPVACHDLSPEAFDLAWTDFCQREFTDSFTATRAHLMENRGKWRTVRVFPFRKHAGSATRPSPNERCCA